MCLRQAGGHHSAMREKVTFLKNVTDLNAAIVGNGDPVLVLKSLADAGWKIYGDYELKIYKNP
jgi:hypothetical protein